jgi:membrane protein CcdC involved in cytochrome C biogenesis
LLNGANALLPRFRIEAPHFIASDWIWRYFLGYHALLNPELSVIPCPLGLAAFAVLYFSFRFRDYRFPLLCLWCIAMVFVSLTSLGSNFNLPQFDVHRAIIILPPLAAGVVVFYHVYISRLNPSVWVHRTIVTCACFAMIYMIYTGLAVPLTVRTYVYYHDVSDCDEALYKIDCLNFDPKMEKLKKLYILPPLRIEDLELGLQYFAPSAEVIRDNPPPGEKEPGTYLLSYLSDKEKEEDRIHIPMIPSWHARPYLQLKKE